MQCIKRKSATGTRANRLMIANVGLKDLDRLASDRRFILTLLPIVRQTFLSLEAAPCAGARNGIYIQRIRSRGGVRFRSLRIKTLSQVKH